MHLAEKRPKLSLLKKNLQYINVWTRPVHWHKCICFQIHGGPENLKKSRPKKLVKSNKSNLFFRKIAFLAVLNFFPVQKLIFGHFWNGKKWNWVKKMFFVKLIHLISRVFLAWTFLNFLARCVDHCVF